MKNNDQDLNCNYKKEDKVIIRILNNEFSHYLGIEGKWLKSKKEHIAFKETLQKIKEHPNYDIVHHNGRKNLHQKSEYNKLINDAYNFFKEKLNSILGGDTVENTVRRRNYLSSRRWVFKKKLSELESELKAIDEKTPILQKRKIQLIDEKIKNIKEKISEVDNEINLLRTKLNGIKSQNVKKDIVKDDKKEQPHPKKIISPTSEKRRGRLKKILTGESILTKQPHAFIKADPFPSLPKEEQSDEKIEKPKKKNIVIEPIRNRRKDSCLQKANNIIKKYSVLCMKDDKTKSVSFNTLILNYKIEYGYKGDINTSSLISTFSQLLTEYETVGYIEKTFIGNSHEKRFKFLKAIPESFTLDDLMSNSHFKKTYAQKQRHDFEFKLLYNYKLFIFNLMRDKKYNFKREDFEEYLGLRCDMVFQKLIDEILLMVTTLNYIKEINETKTYAILKKVEDNISLNGLRLKYQMTIKDGNGSETND